MSQSSLPHPSADWALFLDFDGSLVELAATPDAVHVDDDLLRLLEDLEDCFGGALAIVSGRPIAQLDDYLAPHRFPAAGLHGLERRRGDGTPASISAPSDQLADIANALDAFAAAHPGVLVEDKGATIALHYRRAPQFADACGTIMRDLAAQYGDELGLLTGKMVFELKPAHIDKGQAIDGFMAETPFAKRTPVFCGDDVTDEPGFAAVNRHGGVSIRVGDNGSSAARFRIADVGALFAWLRTIPEFLRTGLEGEAR